MKTMWEIIFVLTGNSGGQFLDLLWPPHGSKTPHRTRGPNGPRLTTMISPPQTIIRKMAILSRYLEIPDLFPSSWYSYRVLVAAQKKKGEKDTQGLKRPSRAAPPTEMCSSWASY